MSQGDVADLVHPTWKPLRHIEAGWAALEPEEQRVVQARLADVLARHEWPDGVSRRSLQMFFTFLAQVETIAIEIPLRFLPHAAEAHRALLRHQLTDEVFHSVLFARLAHDLSLPAHRPPAPLESAERLLDGIRTQGDLQVSATLLNLVAEGWIENLFRHAAGWNVAPAVFDAVLEDEARHVHEAQQYLEGDPLPPAAADAVATLEAGLAEVTSEPAVSLAVLDLAGPTEYRALVDDLYRTHREHLAEVGLLPSAAWRAIETATLNAEREGWLDPDRFRQAEVVPDTAWRKASRRVWAVPRDPTMQGDFDVRVGHIRKRLLTPVIVAALGKAWAENPRLNRIVSNDRVWDLPEVNVGVRVLVADDELATVVVTRAHQRSVRDISRMIVDGYQQLKTVSDHHRARGTRPVAVVDDTVTSLAPPNAATSFSIALSNPGKFGMVAGAGAFSGEVGPSTDISIGQRRRMPHWTGVAYVPKWHVNFGCLQDHRVFDGREAGLAMTSIRQAMSRKSVREILRRPDTLIDFDESPEYTMESLVETLPPALRLAPMVGIGKYAPLAIGGAALGIGAGVGGYFLFQELGRAGATTAGTAGAAAAATGGEAAGAAVGGVCAGTTAAGEPCKSPASGDGYCWRHGAE